MLEEIEFSSEYRCVSCYGTGETFSRFSFDEGAQHHDCVDCRSITGTGVGSTGNIFGIHLHSDMTTAELESIQTRFRIQIPHNLFLNWENREEN
jgi:hypothetical protein